MYVVDRDFGFAPNPFHGCCTLATCKPPIRAKADLGDWVVGMGGARLKATGRCIYAMQVTEALTFDEYWKHPIYFDKRPVRNGSKVMMVGDNIYHHESARGRWHQTDSHHSNPDGTPNPLNIKKDTGVNRILVSRLFFYFGRSAPTVPAALLHELGYKNGIGHRVFEHPRFSAFLNWLIENHHSSRNRVTDDPFNFEQSAKRYSGKGSSLV